MITARYEPSLLFPRERSPSPHLGTSRRGCTPPPSSSSLADGEDIDRFMELAHEALEEATKEEDAKGILHELVERVLVKTGAPLLADVIAEQWRSQEVIEQLAERSFERQRRRQLQQQRSSLAVASVSLSASKKKRRTRRPASDTTHKHPIVASSPLRPSSSPIQHTVPSSSSLFPPSPSSLSSSSSTSSLSSSTSILSSPLESVLSTSESESTMEATLKDPPHDPDSMEEAVIRDQFTIQQSHSSHAEPDRLLLISEYIWRLFRLLILASLVALVYHYVCTYPQQLFLVV